MRLRKLIRRLKSREVLPYLVTDPVNIRYLTGFAGSYAYMVIASPRSFFITDSRYEEYAESILPGGVDLALQRNQFLDSLVSVVKGIRSKRLFIEEHSTPFSLYRAIKERLGGVAILPGGDEVNHLRMVKDDEEIAVIKKAAKIVDACVAHLKKIIRAGDREWDIAVEIEHFFRTRGARKSGFDSIVASGPGSSMPHYVTSMKKKLRPGEPLLVDMGCEYMGYNSDLTRTLFVHSIDPTLEGIYRIVREAQEAALDAVRPGITTGRLDATARDIIDLAGYGERFGHSLGHGIGMEVHELPAVKAGDATLKKNMVITVEPGIYLPGVGGVRIEDMVLVTSRGREVLTSSQKGITIVG